jgi:peptidyl-prolyl cis-trans isomerase A (cyclophilin A)
VTNPLDLRTPALGGDVRRRAGAGSLLLLLAGCVFRPPPPLPEEVDAQRAAQEARIAALKAGTAVPPAEEPAGETDGGNATFAQGDAAPEGMSEDQIRAYAIAQGDPEQGEFTLDEALEGLPGKGGVWAKFETARGPMECELLTESAPRTVANFVGLARGVRPFRDPATKEWVRRPYYDGTIFHRVIPGFMIQGGDPEGTGIGSAGYVIAEERDERLRHDRAGILSMANRGPGTGSGQFFITLAPASHLDGKHTIFGRCNAGAVRVADDISLAPRNQDDRPTDDEPLVRVTILRR